MNRRLFASWLMVALFLLACRVQVDLPTAPTAASPVTEELHIPAPPGEMIALTLQFGVGRLSLRPGAEHLVDGTARYVSEYFKPEVTSEDGAVILRQAGRDLRVFANRARDNRNEWDLQIGAMPLDLTIEAGACQAEYEFGGLSLRNLTVRDGASTVKGRFSQPNPLEMSVLRYETGASNVTLTGLANANFALFEFDGGAGNYIFEFGGEWRRSASVHIAVGMSNVTLVIPAGRSARITMEGLGNVSVPDSWSRQGNAYVQRGEEPSLTIVVEMGAGNLTILAAMP